PPGQHPLLLLKTLQLLWTKKEMEKLKEETRRGFAGLRDPLAGLLDMLEGSSDWKGKGHVLWYYISTELELWIKEHPAVQQPGPKLKKLQARVLRLLDQCPANLLEPLVSLYQLRAAERRSLLEHVSQLWHRGAYKEVAVLSIKLKLQQDQDVEKMCTPLLLQDKSNVVEDYVGESPELQSKLLQTLDSWCAPGFNIRDITRQYEGLARAKPEKLNCKALSKLVFRLLGRFNLDPALCPNVVNQQHLRTLHYLFYKRFVEKTMTEENWAEHVQGMASPPKPLSPHRCPLSLGPELPHSWGWQSCCAPAEAGLLQGKAARAMRRFGMQEERVEEASAAGPDGERKKQHYYQLPIPRASIHLLQSWEETLQCWEKVLQPGQVVGIDMEWRPSFGMVGKPQVSLLQMALKDEVFLLDLPQLLQQDESQGQKKLLHFLQRLYSDAAITKLGYGMSGDLSSLAATCPALKDTVMQARGVVDLLTVDKQVDVLCPEQSSRQRGLKQPEKGLSLLVQHVLGKPLDKAEQLSNWEKRPLREEQILYAASDAYCLLEVYEKLCKDPESFGLSPDLTKSLVGKPSTKARAKKQLDEQEAPSASGQQCQGAKQATSSPPAAISPRELSVVCDNMLQGLGRYLRCLGVDVCVLQNQDDHRKAAEIARQEGRVILTSGLPFQTLQSQVAEGRCLSVNCSAKAKDQALQVLRHFNVQVSLADIFSRCQ
ncbi:putative exonuclease mut-7, partial [Dryobates pubescens]